MHIKPHHRYIVYVTIAFLFGRAFSLPRPAYTWEGTNSTISPGYVEGFEGNFSNIYVDSGIYLNGDLKNDILVYPEQPYSYIVWVSGSNYYAKFGNGSLAYSSTNASYVINSCIQDLESARISGSIVVRSEEYTLSAPLRFTGYPHPDAASMQAFRISLIGDGQFQGTVFKPAQNVNAIILRNGTCVTLSDFEINLPYNNAVDGIYGDGSMPFSQCCHGAIFRNLHIRGGGNTATHWCVNLEQPVAYVWEGYTKMSGYGKGCILINNTITAQYGDSHWEGYMALNAYRNNAVAIKFLGTNKQTTLIDIDAHIFCRTTPVTYTGTIAVFMNWTRNIHIKNLQVEYYNTAIYLENAQTCSISSTYMDVANGGIFFDIESDCEDIRLIGHKLTVPAGFTVTIIDDDVNIMEHRTVCRDWDIRKGNGASVGFFNLTTYTEMDDVHSDFGLSENAGSTTIPSGDSTIQVTHNLFATPRGIWLQGLDSSEVSAPWYNAVGETTFNITVANPVSADRTVKWYATVNQRDK